MAATGLLNINPYRKGVAVDISTKPTSLYIDIQNKERARTEALDRYFMDYDKNINPAGMKANDIDDLTKLQQASKGFYFQNRKAIQNPMLDGGKAYNQFVNFNKQQLALVSQSKDAAARGKVGGQAVASTRAKGWVIAPQTFDDLKANELPVMNPNFRPFDAAKFDAYEPFDAAKYTQQVYKGDNYLSKKIIGKRTVGGRDIETQEISYDPKNNNSIETIAATNYQNNKGLAFHVDEISKDINELKQLNPIYKKYFGRDIQIVNGRANPNDVATALTISLSPYSIEDKQVGQNAYYIAGARESNQQNVFNPQVYIKSIQDTGLPLTESNVNDILSETTISPIQKKEILTKYPNTKLITALPEDLASKYVQKVGKTSFQPDIILMRNDNQNMILGFEGDNGKLTFKEIPSNVIVADVTKLAGGVTANKNVYSGGSSIQTQPTQTTEKKKVKGF